VLDLMGDQCWNKADRLQRPSVCFPLLFYICNGLKIFLLRNRPTGQAVCPGSLLFPERGDSRRAGEPGHRADSSTLRISYAWWPCQEEIGEPHMGHNRLLFHLFLLDAKGHSEMLTPPMSAALTVPCRQEVAVWAESQHPYAHPRVRSVSHRLQGLQGNWPRGDLIWNREGGQTGWAGGRISNPGQRGA
jgi:hypothetical protein